MSSKDNLQLLALPTEIRLRIYELAYSAKIIKNKFIWPEGYPFHLHAGATTHGTPWSILRVCRQLHDEINGMLPAIPDISFHFTDLTEDDMRTWLDRMSSQQISQIRKLSFSGSGDCQQRLDGSRCERGLFVTLPTDIIATDRERFERTMSRATPQPYDHSTRYNKNFYKGFYLLRIRQDVVKIPKAASHPRGSIGQCNSVVDQQRAIAEFITDEGELCVEKLAIVKLLRAIMTDEIPGGPGTGRMWPAGSAAR